MQLLIADARQRLQQAAQAAVDATSDNAMARAQPSVEREVKRRYDAYIHVLHYNTYMCSG